MTFADPQILLLFFLLIPLALWKGNQGRKSSLLFSSTKLIESISFDTRSRFFRNSHGFMIIGLALLILGLARPQRDTGERQIQASGVEIVAAFDLSTSMLAEDFETNGVPANRITVARNVLSEFIEQRPADRIGLVAFAAEAFIASPITLDHQFVQSNLSRLSTDSIEDGTAIGSALIASVDRLRNREAKSRIVILMTDGQSNRGQVPPETAAEVAATLGIKVYTIGVGTHGKARTPVRDPWGRTTYKMMDVTIDEDSLKNIAEKTGGRYFRANSTKTLKTIYDEIEQLEKTEFESDALILKEELYHWAATPGLFFICMSLLASMTWARRLP